MSHSEQKEFEDMWKRYGYEPPKNWRAKGYPNHAPEKECFGWSKRGCKVLKGDYCLYGKCNFYKHHAQYEREVKGNAIEYLG